MKLIICFTSMSTMWLQYTAVLPLIMIPRKKGSNVFEKWYKSLLTFVMEKIRVNKIVHVLKIAQLPGYVLKKKV